MHKILLYIITTLLAIAAFACGETHYDSRLTAIDSIIDVSPDSALAELRALDYKSLSGSDNRAYYALLLTQARYKSYDSIPSTDTIEIAVARFTSNGDREKLTRSLIYKGATLEELGKPVEAMEQYKLAEETAAPTDYFNLGYTNFRMANLYHNAYAESELHIEKYKRAYHYYTLANNSIYQLKCLENIGILYRASDLDSSYHYITETIKMAKKIGDKESEYVACACLSRVYEMDSLFACEKEIAKFALNNGSIYVDTISLFYDLCRAYSNLGMPDSAQYYLDKAQSTTTDNSVTSLLAQVDLLEIKGNYKMSLHMLKKAEKTAFDTERSSYRQNLFYTEKDFDSKRKELQDLRHQKDTTILLCIIFIIIVSVISSAIIIYIKYRHNISILQEQLSQLKIDSILQIEQHLKNEKKLTDSVSVYIEKAKKLTEIYHLFGNHPQKLREKFHALIENDDDKAQFWEVLRAYTNSEFDNAIEKIMNQYPSLSDTEINFICMLMCDFSNVLITVYMGFKSSHYIYNKKKMIAVKMNLEENLDTFLSKLCHKKL